MCAIPVNGRKWGENDLREFGQGRPEWCPMKKKEAKGEIEGGGNSWWYVCSECHGAIDQSDLFCRHCGAKMKKNKKVHTRFDKC